HNPRKRRARALATGCFARAYMAVAIAMEMTAIAMLVPATAQSR
ncbi:hypothetical protein BACCELL_03095, partial [Bacteroides cellulosilyticus DSM 14838]